ncbi:MAG: glycosyltransferase family 39 protein [Deltaproteobacteria bacterium]|nr:glycosyltransferase family 39 protein [Deltaproteobacteria bacterium]
MSSSLAAPFSKRIALVLPIVVTAVLLFVGLGSFGLWEPHEVGRTDLVAAYIEGGDPTEAEAAVGPGLHFGERLAALSWSVLGRSETTARLPSAVLAFLSVLVLYLTTLRLAGPRVGIYAALIFSSAPVLLLHGRQLTSGAPLLFGETCALAGLALIAFDTCRRSAVIGAVLAVIGVAFGWLSYGLLIGVAVPAAAVLATLAYTGDLTSVFSTESRPSTQRQVLLFIAGPVLLLTVGAFVSIAVTDTGDTPWVTGGLAQSPLRARSFEYGLSLLAYGWFPWAAIAPLVLLGVLRRDDDEDDTLASLRVFAICALAAGYLAHNVFTAMHGPSPLFMALPMSLAVALTLTRLERSRTSLVLAGLFTAALLAILIRDFAQRPATILMSLAWDGIKLPDEFKPVLAAGLAASPFAALLVLSTFFGAGDPKRSRWRSWRTAALVPLAAVGIGGYVCFVLVPGLSVDLSSRHVVEAYERFAQDGAPLAVLGSRPPIKAEKLSTETELLEWLENEKRVFAMFPPAKLASIDRSYRQATGKHVFLLDAESDRYMLATNKPKKDEKDRNPIAPYVSSKPFDPPPKKTAEVNFDDKVTFLGWELRSEGGGSRLEQGKEFELTSYWRCDAKMSRNYKVFIHIDGGGPRIHGDHMPVKDRFSTREWRPGDYIKDVYKGDVPLYQATGKYRIRIGMYKGKTRMKILDDPTAKENAVQLGNVDLK